MTPMMTQYLNTKEEYPDCILFYRLGDFYEMFFDDAKLAAKELELTLTGKDCGLEERAPMCGIPYHSAEVYLNRLVLKGYKVAIAEQVEDAKLAKGLVKREVVRVVTPGTITSSNVLKEDKNNYLLSISYSSNHFGIAAADISTGDFYVTEAASLRELYDEINKYCPSEIICNHAFKISGAELEFLKQQYCPGISFLENKYYDEKESRQILLEHFKVSSLEGLGLFDMPEGSIAAGASLKYLYNTQKSACPNISSIRPYSCGEYMILDSGSKRNLELLETMREKRKQGSLLWVLDKTKTAMGARLLRSYLEQPMISIAEIEKRYEAVQEFLDRYIDREELREYLDAIYDLERLIGRISSGLANTKDLLALSCSLRLLPHVKAIISTFSSNLISDLNQEFDTLDDVYELIFNSISEEAPAVIKEGGIIKEGYSEEVDKLRKAGSEGKVWLAELEAREREKTGIKTLKIKFNKVFGYYFEVTNSYKSSVPDYFIRKQTLANAERYTISELSEIEELILGANDKLTELEYNIFNGIREEAASQVERIQKSAKALAAFDVLIAFAAAAHKYNYIRPTLNSKGIIDIKEGRHPVVERMLKSDSFIPNDTFLDGGKNRMSIITGPNMAGKSTYMRQNALIVLMAQIGAFVPAKSADLCICDRIFTRVGASDDLGSGQSTFMVEMNEVANILRNATKNSLIILDEIGRGTSTFDGLSIAWAVVEHILNIKILGAKTLFATHYHELTELEGSLSGVNNYCVSVKERGDNITFLRKIVRGGADKSYGIQVAKLAGIPENVIKRAKELLEELSGADIANNARYIAADKSYKPVPRQSELEASQLSIFDTVKDDEIISEIREINLSSMTPIDALNTLYRLQNTIKNRV